MATLRDIQPVLAHAAHNRDQALPLTAMAKIAGFSPFRFHRIFTAIARETPKGYTDRLRLHQAATLLLSTKRSVLEIALDCGYQSHEVFLRAFRRRFHTTPQRYRSNESIPPQAADYSQKIAPCVAFYRYQFSDESSNNTMTYSIETRQLAVQPILAVRRRVKRSDIAPTIANSLGAIIAYAMQHGCAIAGHPICRYPEIGAGMVTLEPSMRVAKHPAADPGSDIMHATLPEGSAAVVTHLGPYDQLPAAYAALEVWMHENGYMPSGAPWEDYVTDPAESPDPSAWRTDVYWPISK